MERDSVQANGISQRTVHQDGRCHLWPMWGSSLPLAGYLCSNPSVKRFQKGRSWFNFKYDPEILSFIPQLISWSQSFLTQLSYIFSKSTHIYLHLPFMGSRLEDWIRCWFTGISCQPQTFQKRRKSNQHFQLSRICRNGEKKSTTLNFERETVRRICSPKIDLKHVLVDFDEFCSKCYHEKLVVNPSIWKCLCYFFQPSRVRVTKSRSFKDSTIGTT